MEEGYLAAGGFEEEETVVFDGHIPEVGAGAAADAGEIAEEPAGEVDEVGALVEQFAAAGKSRIGAPFALVAGTAAVAVAAAG